MEIIDRGFLPTFTKSVHASSVVLWKEHLVFSWFGGIREGDGSVAIYIHNLKGNGETIVLGNKDNVPRWNPILFTAKDKIFLFEKAGRFCDCWQTFIHDITHWDEKTTQKEMRGSAQYIPSGLNGSVKTAPIIQGNFLICGSSVETAFDWSSYIEEYWLNKKHFHFRRRSDPLRVKEKKSYIDYAGRTCMSLGVIQPCLWKDNSGKMHALMRSSYGLSCLYYSRSVLSNVGDWIQPVKTNIPNPNSGVDTVYYDGQLYLAYNPDENNRFPLLLSKVDLHYDSVANNAELEIGETIEIRGRVEESDMTMSSELSYPYMILDGGVIHLTYTYGRSYIEYCKIDVK